MRYRAVILAAAGLAGAANAPAAIYYVSAGAPADGDGSPTRPFGSLEAVERASSAGDSIIVLPSPLSVPALDGGIALKPGQRLIGAGPAVIGRPPDSAAPRIANTRDSRLAGDAVRVADGATVGNLVIVSARRGAIYGQNARNIRIENNDITNADESCSPGLSIHVAPPSNSDRRPDGFAAIMLDFDGSRTSLVIDGNFIHDSSCSDGIDVRAVGHAEVFSRIDGNVITRLEQGAAVGALLGIGLQTREGAVLNVSSSHNAETYLGNPMTDSGIVNGDAARSAGDRSGADCKGVFTGQSGGTIVWNIDRNTFAHGSGGSSCNGAQFLVGTGAAHLQVVVRGSIFEDNPGDMIEENNLGTDSVMDVMLDNVTVRHVTRPARALREPPLPEWSFKSFTSRSACVSQVSLGVRAITRFAMTRGHFSDCAGDGILSVHASLPELGMGQGTGLDLRIDHSSIVSVGEYALHWINYTTLDEVELEVEGSRLEGGIGYPAVSLNEAGGARIKDYRIDLGGGPLGSLGQNCFSSASALAADLPGGGIAYAANWWGTPAGPAERMAGGVAPLSSPPPSCQLPAN
jgi:hypothetical protein